MFTDEYFECIMMFVNVYIIEFGIYTWHPNMWGVFLSTKHRNHYKRSFKIGGKYDIIHLYVFFGLSKATPYEMYSRKIQAI